MRRLAPAAAIGLAASAAAAACSSGYGATGGAPDASADAPSEAATPPSDAGATDAEAGPFCASKKPRPLFCDDFDLSRAPGDGWSFTVDYGPDAAVIGFGLDEAGAYSPPASFGVTTSSINPGFSPGIIALLAWNSMIPRTATALHVETKIRVESVDRNRFAWLVVVRFGPTSDSFVALQTSQQASRVAVHTTLDGGADGYQTLSAQLPIGTWSRATFDFTFAPPSVVVGIDGATQTVPLDATFATGVLELELGEEYFENVTLDATSLHYDDVLVDVH